MATNQAADRSERFTWDEICARHPDRWVVLGDIDWVNDTDFDFRGAEVIATFTARKAASPTMRTLISAGDEVGCFWTGELIPKSALPVSWRLR
jgi:hypothetical protein